ncbi:MAG: KOW domain-containing protein [Clostridiales bacterium]|nr:KOW domain-containing protein [Clostridiales bacterium]
MKASVAETGRVVLVTQGHDAGSICAVLQVIDEKTVLLVDGKTRTLQKPKRKNILHLRAYPLTIAVEGKGGSGGPIADSDIRKQLKKVWDAYQQETQGVNNAVTQQKEDCAFV